MKPEIAVFIDFLPVEPIGGNFLSHLPRSPEMVG
jgi:hypothetical protein